MTGHEGLRPKGKIPKYRTSCDNCQTAKVKCGHEKPSCRRCSVHRVDCVYSLSRRMGRPRAKRVAANDPNQRQPSTSEPNENETAKAASPEDAAADTRPPRTPVAETCIAEAEQPGEPSASDAGQIPENWVPLFGDLGQLNASEGIDGLENSEQQDDDPMEFLSAESPMELGDMASFTGMPSFLDSLSGSLEPQATTSAVPAELFGPQEILSFALPNTGTGDDANAFVPTQQRQESSSEPCTCRHSTKSSRRESRSVPSNKDESGHLSSLPSAMFLEASYSPQEVSSCSPSNTSQPSDASPSVQASCDGSSELSWRKTRVMLRQGHCNCMDTITERIASLKAEQQSPCSMPMDCVLMLEKEVQESLCLLHKCKNCRLDSFVHLLALVSVRMMLDILQKTARSEFIARPKSTSDNSNEGIALCIGAYKVPSRVRCRFLRKTLQARFHKLAALVEERERLVTGKKQDSFSKSASLLLDSYASIEGGEQVTAGQLQPAITMEPSHLHNMTARSLLVDKLQNAWERPFVAAAISILIPVISVVFFDWLNYQQQRRRLGNIPIVGDAPYLWKRLRWTENEADLKGVIQRGYDTFSKKLKPWAYWGQHDDFILVLPPGTCDEVKNADLSQMSFLQAVEDSYHFRLHTNILGRSHVDAVRQSVNKNMNQEPFAGFLQIWHLVHLVAASFLIGPHFSRNPEYMAYIEDYCLNVPHFVHLYFWVPAPLRRLFWYFSPWGFRVRRVIRHLKSFIIPEIRRTITTWRLTERDYSPDKYTLLRAMLDLKEERGQITREATAMTRREEERQINIFSDEVVFTAFDSAGPVACLVTQLLFESIRDPSLTEALRAEIAKALAENGGEWSVQMMSSLPRLESFTRETLRVDGPTLFSVTRSILKPFQLKSGLVLRPGNIISSPSWMIHNDEDNYPNAKEFNPYRFYDETTNTVTTKATTASNTFLAYGYGSQMCPGRYLGVRMTQIIFAKLLMRYDATFEGGRRTKPENIVMPGQVLPSYYSKIVLKLRQEEKI
ncbi:cytochrome P450 [Trichoderma citrinoviride]|uniref:Cytochrome P450 n=1 Tax=Trichoderma citrinoviride TaxID=58853 RepID=A0A2T4AYQ5_9HYPO|nr:cytochrome P450 [Trichoderma citrinoviride]PTB62203.1 cytochrome P450 [Trichoderma citrinoviride]